MLSTFSLTTTRSLADLASCDLVAQWRDSGLRKFLVHVVSLLLAVQIVSGHWMLLQTVAWVHMFVVETGTGTPAMEAAKWVLGDAKPCQLCKAVSDGHSEEQKQPLLTMNLQWDMVLPTSITITPPTPVLFVYPMWDTHLVSHVSEVPHRPPRMV